MKVNPWTSSKIDVICPSVCLSVCGVGGSGSHNCTPSLFVAHRPSTYSQGNGENLGRLETLLSLTLAQLCEETWGTLI